MSRSLGKAKSNSFQGETMPRAMLIILFMLVCNCRFATADDSHSTYFLWPQTSTNRSTSEVGRVLPTRENENPPAVRITDIETPFMKRFDPPTGKANGTSVVIVPGGAYRYAVVGKEGAEIADWFNRLGVTAFVLYYRTPTNGLDDDWVKPVQDVQRSVRLIRSRANDWNLDSNRVGTIGFSAGGNAAAIASTKMDVQHKEGKEDQIDEVSARPDFTMLIYPWKLLNEEGTGLRSEVAIDKNTPPTLLIHAHNDGVTSLSSIEYYKAMKRLELPAELHIYESGGHGYGLRRTKDANVHTWPERAASWMQVRGLLKKTSS